jgi:hypothetical protein
VQQPGGQGIRKVKVDLMGRQRYEAVTDEAGQFKVLDVEPGTYLVQLERSGYAASGKASRRITIKVIAGQDTKGLVFHMLAAAVITGKLIDLEGDPLVGVSVTATKSTGSATTRNPRHGGSAVTNDLGEYRIADLPPGTYIVHADPPKNAEALPGPNQKDASKDRLIYVTTYFPGTLDERQAAPVEVPAGGRSTRSCSCCDFARPYHSIKSRAEASGPHSGNRSRQSGAVRGEHISRYHVQTASRMVDS